MGAGPTIDARERVTVLFLAASPRDQRRLDVGEEARLLSERLAASAWRDHVDLRQEHEVRLTELTRHLLRYRPAVLHFAGHGGDGAELLFVGDGGLAAPADPTALSALIAATASVVPLRLVVLNACHSEALARALSAHVDCVVGSPHEIADASAQAFAATFYEALGYGHTVADAHRLAVAQASLVAPTPHPWPVVHYRDAAAGSALRLFEATPRATAHEALAPARAPDADVASLAALLTAHAPPLARCLEALRATDPDAPRITSALEAVRHLADLPPGAQLPRLAAFSARLAARVEGAARAAFLAWAEQNASAHGADPSAVHALAEPSVDGRHALVVVLDEAAGGVTLRAWLCALDGAAPPTPVRCPEGAVPLDRLPEAVDDALQDDPVYELLARTGERLLVELVAPLASMLAVTARAFVDAGFAREHDVVLRWRERVYERVKRPPRGVRPGLWARKWKLLHAGACRWLDASAADPEAELSLDACAAVAVPSDLVERDRALALLERALRYGVPVVAWLCDDAPARDAAPLDAVRAADPREALDRVTAARRDAPPAAVARYVSLLWDDFERRPPDALPPALLAAPR